MRRTHSVLAIALCGILAAIASPILAQGVKPLVLKKGDEVVVIPAGDWVVATDTTGKTVLGTGKYQDTEDGTLILQESPSKVSLKYLDHVLKKYGTTWGEHRILITDIAILYQGEAKRVGYYTRQGLKQGLLTGGVGGSVLGVLFGLIVYKSSLNVGLEEGEEPEPVAPYLTGGALLGVLVGGFYGGLIGIPLGFISGLVKHGFAKRYPIGPGQWEIVVE